VADHRRHHSFSDQESDPRRGLAKGLFHAHVAGCSAGAVQPRAVRPDLLADPITRRVDRLFPALVAVSVLGPAAMGGLLSWSWQGALTGFFWGGLGGALAPERITAKLVEPGRVRGEPAG
jgi:stearoyl-CoA desaturase (Delta-9 desaturase)